MTTRQRLDHFTLSKVGVQEETAELNQIIAKIDRFGLHNHHPGTGISNLDELAGEIGDVYGAMGFYLEELARRLTPEQAGRFEDTMAERGDGKKAKLIALNTIENKPPRYPVIGADPEEKAA